eukprot:32773-Hanusia_phi.AAC.1
MKWNDRDRVSRVCGLPSASGSHAVTVLGSRLPSSCQSDQCSAAPAALVLNGSPVRSDDSP